MKGDLIMAAGRIKTTPEQSEFNKKVYDFVKDKAADKGISLRFLAKKINKSEQSFFNYKNNAAMPIEILLKLSLLLDFDLNELKTIKPPNF